MPAFLEWIHPWRTVSRYAHFASSSHNVLLMPSNLNPRMIFFVAYLPSRYLSFFSEMGSFESTSLAGKTSCIPAMVPILTW